MRTCIGIGTVTPPNAHVGRAPCPWRARGRSLRQLRQFRLDLHQTSHVTRQPPGVAEHILGTQEQPRPRMAATDEHEPGGQSARRLQRRITP